MNARTTRLGLVAAGLTASVLALSGPALAAGAGTIHVPSDFDPALSDTRATGSYDVVGTGLHIVTTGSAGTDKVAEYVDTATPLASTGEPAVQFTNTSGGGVPGFQQVVDFDGNGTPDGILVGEPASYGNDWWAPDTKNTSILVSEGAPHKVNEGTGSRFHGTLDEWRAAFPNAQVKAFGFALGSYVEGDGTIDALSFADTRYTFARDVKLASRDQCKNGGYATSTMPTFRNQGECVSSFASAK